MIMNPIQLFIGAGIMVIAGFLTARDESLSSSLVAGGLILLWIAISVICAH